MGQTKTMKAAVVREFGKPLTIEEAAGSGAQSKRDSGKDGIHRSVPHGPPCGDGRLASEAAAAVRSRPRRRRLRCRRGQRRQAGQGRRSGWNTLALFGVRILRTLPGRMGDSVRAPAERRLFGQREFCGICHRGPSVRGTRSERSGSDRDRADSYVPGVTVYKGLKMTEARPGNWVVISGVGGLGHLAVRYAPERWA